MKTKPQRLHSTPEASPQFLRQEHHSAFAGTPGLDLKTRLVAATLLSSAVLPSAKSAASSGASTKRSTTVDLASSDWTATVVARPQGLLRLSLQKRSPLNLGISAICPNRKSALATT